MNPVNGAVGLLWTGNWHVCQAIVKTMLRDGTLRVMPELMALTPASKSTCTNMWKFEETATNLNSNYRFSNSKSKVSPKRKRIEEFKKLQLFDLDLCFTPSFTGKQVLNNRRPGTPFMN